MSTDTIPFTITNDAITAVIDGATVIVRKGAVQFNTLLQNLLGENWAAARKSASVMSSIEQWAKGKFTWDGHAFLYEGAQILSDLNARIIEMARSGESPEPLFHFWERLKRNPSHRSVQQLFRFLANSGIPITDDGCFLTYKSVTLEFRDHHSGLFDNHVGVLNRMDRNLVSDDPDVACDQGLHVGARSYALGFYDPQIIVICKVDPEHVVSVPKDHLERKMRVCEYSVVAVDNGAELPSTSIAAEEMEVPDIVPEFSTPAESLEEAKRQFAAAKTKTTDRFGHLDFFGLMSLPIDELRKYAAGDLKIARASKILGGKEALITAIIKARG